MKRWLNRLFFINIVFLLFILILSNFVVAQTVEEDLDLDGFNGLVDCDDNNKDISPQAVEIVSNGVDDDCDTLVDEGIQTVESEVNLDIIEEEFSDEELEVNPGLTPDSAFYFLDGLSDSREEKIAEIAKMIEEGNIDAAREALNKYNEYIQDLEENPDPSIREEARRSTAKINKILRGLENNGIDDKFRKEFVDDVRNSEGEVVTAVEIADKIKDLCSELHKRGAWEEFERVCNMGDRGQKWQKDLFADLSDEQRKEAKEFFNIMMQCMESSGRECKCSDIPHDDFALKCAEVAPLAVLCDEGDEGSCDKMDELTNGIEDLLPEHLKVVLETVEDRFEDFGVPLECKDAGITGRNKGDREKCEEIMFKMNAPPECIDAGLTDAGECGKFMFGRNAPQECVDAGLTGEDRDDPRDCEKIMRGSQGKFNREGFNDGGFGVDCKGMEDPKQRLDCYDRANKNFDQHFEESKGDRHWPQPCVERNTLTRESCEETMRNWGEKTRDEHRAQQSVCAEQCRAENAAWTMRNGVCECFNHQEGEGDFDRSKRDTMQDRFKEDFDKREDFNPEEFSEEDKQRFAEESGGEFKDESGESFDKDDGKEVIHEGSLNEDTSTIKSGSSDGSSGSSDGESSGSEGGGITGNVVGNRFLDYYFR